jgi:hypothetical protein
MADLAEQLEALRAARASGLRRVRMGNREMEYRSDVELARAIADLEGRIAAAGRPAPATIKFSTSKGL